MRGGGPSSVIWSGVAIDVDKNMLGYQLNNLDRQDFNETNLIRGGNFETNADVTLWTLTGAGATWGRSAVQVRKGVSSGVLTRVGNDCYVTQAIPWDNYFRGRQVTVGAWVYATVANQTYLQLNDGVTWVTSPRHSGIAGWEWLTVTLLVGAAAAQLIAEFDIITGNTASYIDGAILVEGNSCPAFAEHPLVGYDQLTRYKVTSEIVNNSIVLQDDDELAFPVGAQEVWDFELYLRHRATAVANLYIGWTHPAGSELTQYLVPATHITFAELAHDADNVVTGTGADRVILRRLLYRGGAAAGIVQFQWAQQVAQASNTTVYFASYIKARRLW